MESYTQGFLKASKLVESKKSGILGTFEGVSLDTKIVNHNGWDAPDPVWDVILASEEFKTGMKNGWFIGFLGHPEDPDCQDFQQACIVMTECRRDGNGKIHAKFNLADTPVGRIVKNFMDAGVIWAVSIRGIGDIVQGSVDPDTFVFRGFDLVVWPAYDEAVPKYTAIAASKDGKQRQAYSKIAASIRKNVKNLSSINAINTLIQELSPQSDEYRILASRKAEIEETDSVDLTSEKLLAMTKLYLDTHSALKASMEDNKGLQAKVRFFKSEGVKAARTSKSFKRIASTQLEDLTTEAEHLRTELIASKSSISRLHSRNLIYRQETSRLQDISARDKIQINRLKLRLAKTVSGQRDLKASTDEISRLRAEIAQTKETLAACRSERDKYREDYERVLGRSTRNSVSANRKPEFTPNDQTYSGDLGEGIVTL